MLIFIFDTRHLMPADILDPQHLIRRLSLLEEGFLCLFNLVGDDAAMIREAGE